MKSLGMNLNSSWIYICISCFIIFWFVFTNENKSILYAIPNGYVGPDLVKKDLKFLGEFDKVNQTKWTYIVDTSKAKVVNPINPFLLKGLNQFSNMEADVVFAPTPIVRMMLSLTSWINKPDRIIVKREHLELELQK